MVKCVSSKIISLNTKSDTSCRLRDGVNFRKNLKTRGITVWYLWLFHVFFFLKVCNDFTYYLGNEANDSSNWLEPSFKKKTKKQNLKVAAKN